MDALSETLRVVRLVGAIFINGRFTAPRNIPVMCKKTENPWKRPPMYRYLTTSNW